MSLYRQERGAGALSSSLKLLWRTREVSDFSLTGRAEKTAIPNKNVVEGNSMTNGNWTSAKGEISMGKRNMGHPALEWWKIQTSKRENLQRYLMSWKLIQRNSSVSQGALLAPQEHHLMIISSLRAAGSLRFHLLRASTVPEKDRKTNKNHRTLYLALYDSHKP